MKGILIGSAILLASVGTANAAPVAFDLSLSPGQSTNYNVLPNSFSLTVDGLTATFTAGAFTNGLDSSGGNRNISNTSGGYTIGGPSNTLNQASDIRIGRYYGGAGVVTRPGEEHWVDGSGWDNFVTASFSYMGEAVDVAMTSVSFSFFGGNDDFRWGYDLSGDGSYGTGDFLSYKNDANPFSGFGGVESGLFMIGAFDSNDEWKLKSITVDYTPTTPVPLPAGGLLLMGGLGALAIARKFQKA
ncbi:MAG: VPLPA-CTERM sorting domain-containing protein [Roseibium album]|uniref:VPLPA-CTERM protein sorting domain protein n=1 Tax=Roseibium album TaxID=311410 RepID=A0A0M7AMG4_9HYPH|nr:VPLPA-CTERM sorting domain-containing protein [Roseibium album]MBG6147561.1 hypothetical protein [Labrenzia sp. EL_142]MBG6155603.1 hypothetical protein [Labrenzia sp. EL_162]MBG6161058.1 hypothetical protein [Labrenzia sp. EL_195]MBG6194137.1 hypothetical protein [Labrenzia sp. EL_159]MBG6200888.1 hypothetical protein [Labrenzia sp. EL_13]